MSNLTPASRPRLVPWARLRWDAVRNQYQIVFPESAMTLNESGAAIVKLCDRRTIEEIIAALRQQFGNEVQQDDVLDFFGALQDKRLLTDYVYSDALSGLPFQGNPTSQGVALGFEPPSFQDENTNEAPLDVHSRDNVAMHSIRNELRESNDGLALLPMSLLAELTYRCPLKCPYCSNPLELARYRDELDTESWVRVIAEAAELGVLHVHFSGGEPLIRRDLETMIREAKRRDLYSDLSTGATLADEMRLHSLRDAGLDAIQISLLDSDAETNDWLAGANSFDRKRCAVMTAKSLGFYITLNVVLHRHNLDRLADILALAREWNVDRIELAHTQYKGWAFLNRAALLPSRNQVDRAEAIVAKARTELETGPEILHVLPDYFQEFPKPCMSGWGRVFMTVAPDGAALPCPTSREIPGLEFPNVRHGSLKDIWFDSPVFNRFRGVNWMPSPCRECDRREIDFGGCRCQAFLLTGDPSTTDPVCQYSPHHNLVASDLVASSQHKSLQFRA